MVTVAAIANVPFHGEGCPQDSPDDSQVPQDEVRLDIAEAGPHPLRTPNPLLVARGHGPAGPSPPALPSMHNAADIALPIRIDKEAERYPFCVVWTPIAWMTWLFPFLGHVGICDDTGCIYDFRGDFSVGGERMLFGDPVMYWDLSKTYIPSFYADQNTVEGRGGFVEKVALAEETGSSTPSPPLPPPPTDRTASQEARVRAEIMAFKVALAKTVVHFRHKERYSMCSNNCYCMVAAALNAMRRSEEEPVETMWSVMRHVMWHGKYISCSRAMRHFIHPFIAVVAIAFVVALLLIFLLP